MFPLLRYHSLSFPMFSQFLCLVFGAKSVFVVVVVAVVVVVVLVVVFVVVAFSNVSVFKHFKWKHQLNDEDIPLCCHTETEQ